MGFSSAGDVAHRGRNHVSGPATLKADAGAVRPPESAAAGRAGSSQGGEERGGWRCGTEFRGARGEGRTVNCQWESKQTKGAECLEELAFWP